MDANYLILVTLLEVSSPSITRVLSVPTNMTFDELHVTLQIAFGWKNAHLYQFNVQERRAAYMPLSSLSGKTVMTITDDASLDDMLDMGNTELRSSNSTTLSDVLEASSYGDKILNYEYDFGDGWEHSIEVIGRAMRSTAGEVACLAGEGHPGIEDCGGPYGLMELRNRPRFRAQVWDMVSVNQQLANWRLRLNLS